MKKILCPVDYSGSSINAIEYAGFMAKKIKASLTLLNVEHIAPLQTVASQLGIPNKIGEIQQVDFDRLTNWSEEVKKEFGIPCDFEVETDTSSVEKIITWIAEAEHFDLIIMGTNGADDMYQFFFGSNTYHTIAKTGLPLLMVPETCKFEQVSAIITAIDYSESEADLLDQVVYFAGLFGALITVLHVSKKEKYKDQLMYRKYKKLIEDNGYVDVVKFESLVEDDLIQCIENHMHVSAPSLLVLTTHHRNLIEQFFHTSVTKEIAEIADYPVLVIH